jgi:hypothetical protein
MACVCLCLCVCGSHTWSENKDYQYKISIKRSVWKESHERMPPTWDNSTDIFLYEIGCVYEGCFLWRCDPTRVRASSFLRFLDRTQRRTTVGRTPLDELPARRRDLYLTTHNTHKRQTSMPPVGFEPTISTGERP